MTNSRPIAGFLIVLEPAALSSKIPFFLGQNLIGRSESKATLVIKEPSISQKHAKLVATLTKITITDLSSKNGTKINNEGNYIEPENQVLIDNSMIIYLADAKCRIEIIEINQNTTNLQSHTVKVEDKRKQNLNQKKQKIEKESKVQQKKPQKNEFKMPQYPSNYNLEEGFKGDELLEQKQKINRQQKKKSKKNTKSKPQLKIQIDSNEKYNRNIQHQYKNQNEKNFPLQTKPEQQLKPSAIIIKPSKKEIDQYKKRKSPQVGPQNAKFQGQTNQQKRLIKPQIKKGKNQEDQKQKLKKQNKQLSKITKQQFDNDAKKKQIKNSKQKRQSTVVQNEEKYNIKQLKKSKQKNDLGYTLHSKLVNKQTQQTSLENSVDTTKRKIKSRKKMPSQSLQKELRQSARRSIVGKRVLFSGFIPKMRRKYFILVEDYNEEFDYLVMKQYTRTFKALLAISKGILIVNYSWIQESQQSLRTLNVNHYLLNRIQPIYQAIERAKSGSKIFKGYQFYLLSAQYHLKVSQIQTLIHIGGGQSKILKGQVKIKDHYKCIAILRNKQQNSITPELKEEIRKTKKYGFQLIYNIEFLLDACEKQQINWQNSKL